MAGRLILRNTVSADAEADLDAFFRCRDTAPEVPCAGLIGAISQLRGSADPVVTFAGLARACVPQFADGCQAELDDGPGHPVQVRHQVGPADTSGQPTTPSAGAGTPPASPGQILLTPFRVESRTGWPSYAGVVTHWWNGRAPDGRDAVIADLMVKHAIALVDRERLIAAVGRAEDRAASLALRAISGRAVSLATGIVMHQERLTPEAAESRLRQVAAESGTGLPEVAADVLRAGSLCRPARLRSSPQAAPRHLAPADPGATGAGRGQPGPPSRGEVPADGGAPRR